MERYKEYKDSGVQWIGEIPNHWEIRRFKSFFSSANGNGFKIEYQGLAFGDYPFLKVSDLNGKSNNISIANNYVTEQMVKEESYNIIPANSILFSKIGEALKKNHRKINTVPCCIDNNCSAIVKRKKIAEEIDINFAYYLMKCVDMTWFDNGGTIPSVNMRKFMSSSFPLPPYSEQKKIVSYLERKTSKIDEYIAKKDKEVQLLNELKEAEIAKVVTQGLTPNVKMKDSGVSWIGMIPKHWEEKQLRAFLKIFSDKGHGDAQLLSVTRELGVILRDKENKEENHNFVPDDLSGYKYIEKGDFVINKMKAWQGSYAVSKYSGIVSPAYYTCKLIGVDEDFFSMSIRSKAYVGFFTSHSKGIRVGQWDLDPNALKSIPFFLPPLEEQRAIVAYINEKTSKVESLITDLQAEIEHLKEYKQRLIADCVTGQVNVAGSESRGGLLTMPSQSNVTKSNVQNETI